MEASFTVIRLHVLLEYYSLTHWIEKVSFMHPSIYACNAVGAPRTHHQPDIILAISENIKIFFSQGPAKNNA